VCNSEDCQPNNADFPASPGASCDDDNPNTNNDIVTADGCGCEGTPNTSGGEIDCNNISINTGENSIIVTGLDMAPVSSVQVFTTSWSPVFSCFADCSATEAITVPGNGEYLVFVKYYDASYGLVCQVDGTFTVGGGGPGETCDITITPNVTNIVCNDNGTPSNTNDDTFTFDINVAAAAFNGTELWGWNLNDMSGPMYDYGQTVNLGPFPIADNAVTITILDSDNPSCIEVINVNAPDTCSPGGDGGGDPIDCDNISITTNANGITVTGLDQAPVASVQVFTTTWQPVFTCFSDCDATTFIDEPAGDYLVFVKYYETDYTLICQVDGTFTVGGNGGSNNLPTAVNDSATTDASISVDVPVTQNDDFGDDGPNNGSIAIVTEPNNGTAFVNDNGSPNDPTDDFISYAPNNGFSGTDQLTYVITDSDGDTSTAVVTITVNAPNGTPTAINDNASTTENTSVNVPVTSNDSFGPDGPDNGMIIITNSPINGVATVNNNGTPNNPTDDFITYTPNNGFVGSDVLTYVIIDANGDQSSANVIITVEAEPCIANAGTLVADNSSVDLLNGTATISATSNSSLIVPNGFEIKSNWKLYYSYLGVRSNYFRLGYHPNWCDYRF